MVLLAGICPERFTLFLHANPEYFLNTYNNGGSQIKDYYKIIVLIFSQQLRHDTKRGLRLGEQPLKGRKGKSKRNKADWYRSEQSCYYAGIGELCRFLHGQIRVVST